MREAYTKACSMPIPVGCQTRLVRMDIVSKDAHCSKQDEAWQIGWGGWWDRP